MTIQIGNPGAIATAAQLRALRNDLGISQWLTTTPIGPVVRNSANAGADNVDQIMASFVVDPASLSGIRVGSMVEIIADWDVTSSANTKSLRINYTSGAIGPTSITAASVTTNIGNSFRFLIHIRDANTVSALASGTLSGAGATAAAIFTQNSPNVLETGFTITLVGRWNSGFVAGESITLQHAKARLTI